MPSTSYERRKVVALERIADVLEAMLGSVPEEDEVPVKKSPVMVDGAAPVIPKIEETAKVEAADPDTDEVEPMGSDD